MPLEREVKALRDGKIDAARVKEIQSALRYELLMTSTPPTRIAERVGYLPGYSETGRAERHMRHLSQVTPAQLVAFAKKT